MDVEGLRRDLERAAGLVRRRRGEALLVFHDDADGISAGAIAYEALRRAGWSVRPVCVEKLMDQVIRRVHEVAQDLVVYVDIGSPHADRISEANRGRLPVIILDHHDPVEVNDPTVINVNPELHGLEGERDASGSVVTYLFAKVLDGGNRDLAPIAMVGLQEIPKPGGPLVEEVEGDARASGRKVDVRTTFRVLQVLGSAGYYRGGPAAGLRACIEGLSEEVVKMAERLEEERRRANRRMLAILRREGLRKLKHVQWFDSRGVFRGMGTKVIGTFCSYLSYQRGLVDQDKYLVGLMEMPGEIPGLMRLEGRWTKVSMRVPEGLRASVEAGRLPGLGELAARVARELGGVGDGHKFAASAVIPAGREREFLEAVDNYIESFVKKLAGR